MFLKETELWVESKKNIKRYENLTGQKAVKIS